MRTFLSSYDFKTKFSFLFCTNAGWGFGNSLKEIKDLSKNAKFSEAFAYESQFKEKDKRELKSYNQKLILQNKAFDELNQTQIKLGLQA